MQAALMGKSRITDIGRMRVRQVVDPAVDHRDSDLSLPSFSFGTPVS